ncbi:MAG: TlyA family rRNA (cytidine-2'-O)-methyltransferase [Phototrophicales bacterium]
MSKKQRLDVTLFERGLTPSRAKAQGMIMAGEVLVNGVKVDKPGTRVSDEDEIILKSKPRFVSRGGEKLAGALADFSFDVKGLICADIGASTGGFTDCLLQNGAAKIYAIDVGYGLLDYTLRQDNRVVVMEKTNARYIEKLDEPIDLVVVDASFISLKLLMPVFKNWLKPQADVIALIKPQFEAGKRDVGKGGVVRDSAVHERVIQEIVTFSNESGFSIAGLTISPIKGPAGNVEFLIWLGWGKTYPSTQNLTELIQQLTNS